MPVEDNQARAKAFFEKAQKVAQSRNFDYAIDMYLNGLRYAPEALSEGHLPLCELALQRKSRGGKKPSMVEKVKHLRGKTPLDQMLNAEYLFVKDPDHLPYAETMLKAAIAGGYNKTADWIANLIFQTNNAAKKPSLHTYLLLKDSYAAIGEYEKALAACQRATRLKPDNDELECEYKNLSAELTMAKGKYNLEGDFRKSIKDRESQEKLHSQEGVVKTENYRQNALDDARKKISENPSLPTNIFELAGALADMETDEAETEAIELLEDSYESRDDFSFKQRSGKIKIGQLRRKILSAKKKLAANPDDENIKAELEQLTSQLNDFELEYYRLCSANYPTDLDLKYEYALRLGQNEKYDEAIPLFQEAQRNPRRRIAAMNHTGMCFFKKGWHTDAIDIYKDAIKIYPINDDSIGKELRYNLARAYEELNEKANALEIYRKIAQVDFAYKDVSKRVESLRNDQKDSTSQ